MLNLEMLKKAQANVAAKLAKQAQADAQEAASKEENKAAENKLVEVNKTVKTAAVIETIKPEKVTILPEPTGKLSDTATAKAHEGRKAKSAEKNAEKTDLVASAWNIKHGERITDEKELESQLKKSGVLVVYAGNIAAGAKNADWNQCYRATYLSTALFPTLVLEFLHDGQQRGKRDNFKSSTFTLNREQLETARMFFSKGWRAVTCYKLA